MPIILSNNILKLEIQKPGEKYHGSRFDWTGQIIQIFYKNRHSFCTKESQLIDNEDKLGRGLYNEFGIDKPIGYDDCKPGEQFPKIGIGMLNRESQEPYNFFHPYQVNPASFNYVFTDDSITFFAETRVINGYGFKLVKEIHLNANCFSIHYELFNTGSKPILTNEYVHNFLSVNNRLIDESYQLKFSATLSLAGEIVNPEDKIVVNADTISFKDKLKEEFFFSEMMPVKENGASWKLENEMEKIGIEEKVDFTPKQINLWGKKHVISPEIFFEINVEPGRSISWKRDYCIYET
jgi:hypothetical protein